MVMHLRHNASELATSLTASASSDSTLESLWGELPIGPPRRPYTPVRNIEVTLNRAAREREQSWALLPDG